MKRKIPSKSGRTATVSAPTPSDSPPLWLRLWPYLLLIGLAFGIYANALGNGFVSDDDVLILNNPLVTEWREIPQIFQHDSWSGTGQGGNYRPVQMLLYAGLYHCFGFDAFAFHLAMLLIHVGNTVLVYLLGRRLLKSRPAAIVAGILFAVHPIHNQPVVWISAHDVLMTLFVLVGLILFAQWDAAPRPGAMALLAGLFFVALLAKETGAMLVPLLAGYEFFYLGRALWPPLTSSGTPALTPARTPARTPAMESRTLWDNWPLYVSLMGVFGIYAFLRIHALGAMAPWQGIHHALRGRVLIFSIIATLGQYLGKLVLPTHLNYFYFFEPTPSVTLPVIFWLALELGILGAMFWLRPKLGKSPAGLPDRQPGNTPLISFGLFFILMPLAPTLNINGLGDDVFTERYLYLPSVGFVLIAAVAWEWLAAKQRGVAWAAVAVTIVASAWILLPRNLDWHDDQRLFTVTAEASPKSGTPLADLGWVHLQRREYDAAIEKYALAIQREPGQASFHVLLGNAYVQTRRDQEAVAEFRQALDLNPSLPEAHMGLGLALGAMGDIPGAIAEHQRALELKPNYTEAYTALALLRMKEKDYLTAIDLLQRAIATSPRYTEAYVNLGVAYNNVQRYAEAAETFRKAIEVGPAHPSLYLIHYNLGLSYSHLNSPSAAAMEFARSLQLKPDFAAAREALAEAQNLLNQQPAGRHF